MWWFRNKTPAEGLLFPKRRGEGVGVDGRKRSSHARSFRRDLARVFGIEVWNTETEGFEPAKDRPLTARETVLLTETDYTKPVDFHSWRRAFNQALADAGVNSQTSMALAGHSSLKAHERYLRNSDTLRIVPAAALPWFGEGQTAMGKLPDATQEVANTNGDLWAETSVKAAGHDTEANLHAGCHRFKPGPAYQKSCRIRDRRA
jgi:hypothetical protein